MEPAGIALLKQLDPLGVALALLACELASGGRLLRPAFGALGLIIYVISGQLFDRIAASEAASCGTWDFGNSYTRQLLQWSLAVGVLLLAAFAFRAPDHPLVNRTCIAWFLAAPLGLTCTHLLRRKLLPVLEGNAESRYIIIGVNDVGVELARRLPHKGFMGYFDFRSIERVGELLDSERLTGHCKDVSDFVRDRGVKAVYIALPLAKVPRMTELVNALRDTTASVYFVPDAFAFDLIQGRLVAINGMPALSVCDTPLHGMQAVLKRAMDVAIASLGLIVLSPVLLLAAGGVKLTSRGPVLFRQRRYGLDGDEILIYKFRSMKVCEDGSVITQARRADPRVTAIGAFLRRTSLDELPQLINVLEGKMSLVGPRPHAVAHNEQYRKLINGYMVRHKMRPGITGLAQVSGLRGETDTLEKMAARVRYDLEYLRNWSPWLDIKILVRTIGVVISDRRNVY